MRFVLKCYTTTIFRVWQRISLCKRSSIIKFLYCYIRFDFPPNLNFYYFNNGFYQLLTIQVTISTIDTTDSEDKNLYGRFRKKENKYMEYLENVKEPGAGKKKNLRIIKKLD